MSGILITKISDQVFCICHLLFICKATLTRLTTYSYLTTYLSMKWGKTNASIVWLYMVHNRQKRESHYQNKTFITLLFFFISYSNPNYHCHSINNQSTIFNIHKWVKEPFSTQWVECWTNNYLRVLRDHLWSENGTDYLTLFLIYWYC